MICHLVNIILHHLRRKRYVYLDHNATTPVKREVSRTMNRILRRAYGNPSSLYEAGRVSAEIMEESRQQVARAIHAEPEEVIFTGCATESNNAILKSLSEHFYPEKKKIISTPIEHPSVINTLEHLQTRGIAVEWCPVDREGRVILSRLEKLIDKDTFLISCMLANNETGTIQDIPAISALASRYGVLLMSDCVQALAKIPVDVKALGIDYASFAAHKLRGPKGVGALYIKKGRPFHPLIEGGHQEEGLRAGTEGIHNIAGFATACRDMDNKVAQANRIYALKNRLIEGMKKFYPECIIHSPAQNCLPNTISVRFPGIRNMGLMALLDYHGIAVSGGSACSSEEDKPSHVLTAIGLSKEEAEETIRISLGPETRPGDIRYTLKVLKKSLSDQNLLVDITTSEELDRKMLLDEDLYILDLRPPAQRRATLSLPNSHDASYFSFRRKLHLLPKDKQILVVCQNGNLSYLAAHYLRNRGFDRVSSLKSGLADWKKQHSKLYKELGGKNVRKLE